MFGDVSLRDCFLVSLEVLIQQVSHSILVILSLSLYESFFGLFLQRQVSEHHVFLLLVEQLLEFQSVVYFEPMPVYGKKGIGLSA